jgi:hypothetical protein
VRNWERIRYNQGCCIQCNEPKPRGETRQRCEACRKACNDTNRSWQKEAATKQGRTRRATRQRRNPDSVKAAAAKAGNSKAALKPLTARQREAQAVELYHAGQPFHVAALKAGVQQTVLARLLRAQTATHQRHYTLHLHSRGSRYGNSL